MIYLLVQGLALAGTIFAQGLYQSADPSQLALEQHKDGSFRYVLVSSRQDKNRIADPENGIVSVSHSYYSNPNRGHLTVSRPYGVSKENLQMPLKEVAVTVNNENATLKRGDLILASNNELYLLENIYPDGSLAAYRATVNTNSRNRVHGNFTPMVRENIHILDVSDIKAIQKQCFFGYCKNQIYKEIEGVPVCDREVLVSYLQGWGTKPSSKLACRLSGAPVHGVFNDGSLVSGQTVFNPFPKSLEKYRYENSNYEIAI